MQELILEVPINDVYKSLLHDYKPTHIYVNLLATTCIDNNQNT